MDAQKNRLVDVSHQLDDSLETPKHMLKMIGKEIFTFLRLIFYPNPCLCTENVISILGEHTFHNVPKSVMGATRIRFNRNYLDQFRGIRPRMYITLRLKYMYIRGLILEFGP